MSNGRGQSSGSHPNFIRLRILVHRKILARLRTLNLPPISSRLQISNPHLTFGRRLIFKPRRLDKISLTSRHLLSRKETRPVLRVGY